MEPDEIRADLQQLNRVARMVFIQSQASDILPAAIRSRVEALPSRLAVEPASMAAACALHGRRVAQAAGHRDRSEDGFVAADPAREPSPHAAVVIEVVRRLKRMD
jgi:hypothetical protein